MACRSSRPGSLVHSVHSVGSVGPVHSVSSICPVGPIRPVGTGGTLRAGGSSGPREAPCALLAVDVPGDACAFEEQALDGATVRTAPVLVCEHAVMVVLGAVAAFTR